MLTAFQVMQIAMAVFAGNALTLLMVKGYQWMIAEGSPWWASACYAFPLLLVVLVLIGSTS
jgi:hypothetical protein